MASQFVQLPQSGGGGVTSLNGLTGALTLVGSGGITITPGGTTITISGSGGTVSSVGPVGSSPNANAAVITGSVLTLEPADGSNPGLVSTTTQSFAGNKTFTGTVTANQFIGINSALNIFTSTLGGGLEIDVSGNLSLRSVNTAFLQMPNTGNQYISLNNCGIETGTVPSIYSIGERAISGGSSYIAVGFYGLSAGHVSLGYGFADALPTPIAAGTIIVKAGTGPLTLNADSVTATNAVTAPRFIGAPNVSVTTKTTTYTALITDTEIRCNGTFTVTLPASTGAGKLYLIKNIGTGSITIAPAGSDKIDGAAPLIIPTQYACAQLVDGAAGQWDIT
jgi:hypothetical protein